MNVKDISTHCTRTEFVGTTVLDTIGLVISGVDDTLLQKMNIGTKYHTLGLFSSRTGAAGQLTAIDDAVKATNTEVLSIELPRDTKGWGGHGNYIVLGGNDVSDVRHAVQLALELTKNMPVNFISVNPVTWNSPILQAQVLLFRKLFTQRRARPLVLWPDLLLLSDLSWQTLP